MTRSPANPTPLKSDPPARKKRGCLFWFAVVSAVLALMFMCCVGMMWYGYSQAKAKPDFYTERDELLARTGPAELDRIASEAERRISDTITQPHSLAATSGGFAPANPGTPGSFELVLTFDQINAWLAARFNSWATHQGMAVPPSIKGVMMTQEAGDLIFAAEVDGTQFKGVLSMKFHVELVDKGSNPSLMIKLVSVQSGNVPVAGWVLKSLFPEDGTQSQSAQKWLDLLDKGYKVPAAGTLDPKSNRQIRMDDLEVTAQGIRVRMTEMNGKTATQPSGSGAMQGVGSGSGSGASRDANQP
jgi:hypothetical protein